VRIEGELSRDERAQRASVRAGSREGAAHAALRRAPQRKSGGNGRGLIVAAFAVGEETGMAELTGFVAFDAVDGFTVSASARLFLFWIGHVVVGKHSTIRRKKKARRKSL
jgi:hypothetical protein